MLFALMLLAAPEPETAVDAERAFNRAAQTQGQWAAFRQFMTDDAVIFTPQPVKAKDALPTQEPKIAVQWWPAESYVSCDGTMAVNTGPWVRPKGVGYFTTVWVRQADGHFKWVYDGGDALTTARALPEKPRIHRASCRGKARGMSYFVTLPFDKNGYGKSDDQTLRWSWSVDSAGARSFMVELWEGTRYRVVVDQAIAAPK
jgi:hypothetical protein